MKRISTLLLTCILAVFIFIKPIPVKADYLSYGYKSTMLTVNNQPIESNPTLNNAYISAAMSWDYNNTATMAPWVKSKNTIVEASGAHSWYGLCEQTYDTSTGYTTKFTISINYTLIKHDATNLDHFLQSTICHEMGHVYWLADNPNTTRSSIMKYSRDRNTMYKPQSYDEEEVNRKYGQVPPKI